MRSELSALALFGLGVVGFSAAWLVHSSQRDGMADRPEATGEVGRFIVYGQLSEGPTPLQPGRIRALPRPQDFAFAWSARGTGPRHIRIEVEREGERTVLHEADLSAPTEAEPLDYVLSLGDDAPDDLVVIVAVEAPHAMGYLARYPVKLVGSSVRE